MLSALRDKLAAHTRSGEPVILAVLPALLAEIRARSQYRHAAAAERL
ncbi:hypothetical protein QU481_02370 [Crenobacter sp. SG2303]|uniref:Uncharacterized protein n=1 Tax=Crenobacter oryzisoli TaxID=3056844 RepID=A0ABT7XIX9_9NEIS|nr:hypothetical protein [Crenobacter sp. SG2303]MDN0073739.1 hypothetical protein [Crenobacter sp. SG2303]